LTHHCDISIYNTICQKINSEETNDENPVNNLAASHSFGEEPTARDPPPRATKASTIGGATSLFAG